jgi:hypothetical protein
MCFVTFIATRSHVSCDGAPYRHMMVLVQLDGILMSRALLSAAQKASRYREVFLWALIINE